MITPWLRCCALAFCAVLAVAGCSAQILPSGTQSFAASGQRPPLAWMATQAKGSDLLYLSNVAAKDVEVFSYPGLRSVGKLTGFGAPRSECADAQGDIWVADVQGYDVVEFPHGSTKPIVALSTPGAPRGCSVDPTTGNLAVTGGIDGVILAVYHRTKLNKWLDPKEYTDASLRSVAFCGYDAQGNLFIDGMDKAKGGTFRLAELARHATSLVGIKVTQKIKGPGQVQWDGSALAIGDTSVTPSVVYRFSVSGGSASRTGSTTLDTTKSVRQFWVDGARVIGPDYDSDVGVWAYPAGGSPVKRINSVKGYGAAISPGGS
jgi:hypothetical protein